MSTPLRKLCSVIMMVAGLGLFIYGMTRPFTTTGLVFIATVPPGIIAMFCAVVLYPERDHADHS